MMIIFSMVILYFDFHQFNRPFMLAVQSARRAGHLERALDWVILWLKALGSKMALHMTEPISLWVKTKMDSADNSEEDIRLRFAPVLIVITFSVQLIFYLTMLIVIS